jgi:hypothetical protein
MLLAIAVDLALVGVQRRLTPWARVGAASDDAARDAIRPGGLSGEATA